MIKWIRSLFANKPRIMTVNEFANMTIEQWEELESSLEYKETMYGAAN